MWSTQDCWLVSYKIYAILLMRPCLKQGVYNHDLVSQRNQGPAEYFKLVEWIHRASRGLRHQSHPEESSGTCYERGGRASIGIYDLAARA